MSTYTTYRTTSTGEGGEPWPWGGGGGPRTWNIYIYIYIYVYMYIYVYIEREREWESMYFIGCWSPSQNPYNYTMETGYLYIYTYTWDTRIYAIRRLHIYIYIPPYDSSNPQAAILYQPVAQAQPSLEGSSQHRLPSSTAFSSCCPI